MKPVCRIAPLLAFALVACASTPPVVVTLPAPPAPAVARQLDANARTTLTLRGVTLPGYLDSLGVVIGRQANTLVVAEEAEWAERLRDGAARVLRDALS
ncbi:MAG: ABC-type transport auxiliary lipoprotein family protein, partial [Burkholderiales bacterium]